MGHYKSGFEHVTVSTNTLVSSKPCIYYGVTVVNATTAGVTVAIYDASATAQGNLVDMVTVAAGTNANANRYFSNGIVMHTGIYASAIVCTTNSDKIVVIYGGL